MNEVNKYLELLIEFSERNLKEHFNINELELDQFEMVNSYLIYQTIRDNKNNTLIYIPDKETKSQFYIPAIYTLALYNFIDNFIDDTTVYEIGDILQKNGKRFEVVGKNSNEYVLKGNGLTYPNDLQIKSYIISTADLSNRTVKLKFDTYKNFFGDILNENIKYVPSKFKYKSVIVTDKSIVFELKAHKINGEQIHKAFPFQYVAKSGKKTDNIPIDPMIYIVNDYETVREHILTQEIKVLNITFIGENKYKENHIRITEDLNNGKIENCLLIGSTDLNTNAIPKLLKWKWTLAELDYFNYFTTYPIKKLIVNNEAFTIALNEFNISIQKIEKEYDINLNELYKYVRNILPIIIPSSKSRLLTQLDNALIYFEKEGEDIVETILSDIGEYDYDDIWSEILNKFSALINSKKTAHYKFQKIKEFQKIDYLIAPKEYLEIWREEINSYKVKNVISFKEFNSLTVKNKTIVFLGFFGYNHLKSMMYNSNKINILLYPQEETHFNNCENKLNKETYHELKSADRKAISGISFKEIEQIENIDELIYRLFSQDEEVKINPDYSECFATNIIRELTFENDTEKLELDENKTVLLKINKKERFEKVKNLKIGDKIRVYDNSSKEELYQVALEFDINGEFTKIEEFSKLWKSELESFYKEYNSLNELHQILVKNGLSIKNPLTLNNWIKVESDVKFPQKKKDLSVIKKTINSDLLNQNYNDIFKYRIGYNRIMKSLGRKFSSEISDYIQHKRKGKLLKQFTAKQIQQFVDQNAKERIIKTIKAIDYEQ
ncbi:DrmE family protein [Maribacter luteus]|uniref:DrmE family protein n=1 Tax=Maribacter luteus TaxID=2594478 RepID=UPI002492C3ED|nr:DrmE family protein [Maribacter luteus]